MEPDPLLRRLQRNAVVFCLGVAAAAVVLRRGRIDVTVAVLAGGSLIGTSYWAIKTGIDDTLASLGTGGGRRGLGRRTLVRVLAKFVGRYALLGVMAYVMIARLRLHPIGLLTGATSVVAAAAMEAIRSVLRPGVSHTGSPQEPPKQ